MVELEDVMHRVQLADNGQHQIGNILHSIILLVDILERQQQRIDELEQIIGDNIWKSE